MQAIDLDNTYSVGPLAAALDYFAEDEYDYPFFLDEMSMPYSGSNYDPFFDSEY